MVLQVAAKVCRTLDVIIDEVGDDEAQPVRGTGEHRHGGATGRSKADAPEIDGNVHLRDAGRLNPGVIVRVAIEDSDEHDLFGVAA